MAEAVTSLVFESQGEVSGHDAATRAAQRHAEETRKYIREAAAAEKAAKRGGQAHVDAAQKVALHVRQQQLVARIMRETGASAATAGRAVRVFGADMDRAEKEALGLARGLDVAEKEVRGLAHAQRAASGTSLTGMFAQQGAAVKLLTTQFGYLLGAGGVYAVVGALGDITEAYERQARADAQIEARLRSTGNVLGSSVEEFKRWAAEIQRATGVADEELLEQMGILASFKGITKSNFRDATQAIVDMAAALGTDLRTQSIAVGKALDDPVRGVTALRRAGTQFKEEQTDQLKAMVAVGDIAGAQAMILRELQSQYGDTARAIREAGGASAALATEWGDLKENAGGFLYEVVGLRDVMGLMTSTIRSLREATAEDNSSGFVKWLENIVTRLTPVTAAVRMLADLRNLPKQIAAEIEASPVEQAILKTFRDATPVGLLLKKIFHDAGEGVKEVADEAASAAPQVDKLAKSSISVNDALEQIKQAKHEDAVDKLVQSYKELLGALAPADEVLRAVAEAELKAKEKTDESTKAIERAREAHRKHVEQLKQTLAIMDRYKVSAEVAGEAAKLFADHVVDSLDAAVDEAKATRLLTLILQAQRHAAQIKVPDEFERLYESKFDTREGLDQKVNPFAQAAADIVKKIREEEEKRLKLYQAIKALGLPREMEQQALAAAGITESTERWVEALGNAGRLLQQMAGDSDSMLNALGSALQTFSDIRDAGKSPKEAGIAAGADLLSNLLAKGGRNYSSEMAQLGSAIGSAWGPLGEAIGRSAGTLLGSFMKKGGDDAVAAFRSMGAYLTSEVTKLEGDLKGPIEQFAKAVIAGFETALALLGGFVGDLADIDIKIRQEGDVTKFRVREFGKTIREFESEVEAVAFAIQQLLSKSQLEGLSDRTKAALAQTSAGSFEELQTLVSLLAELDDLDAGAGPLAASLRQVRAGFAEIERSLREAGVPMTDVVRLENARLDALRKEVMTGKDAIIGFQNVTQAVLDWVQAARDWNAGIETEADRRQRLLDQFIAETSQQESALSGMGIAAGKQFFDWWDGTGDILDGFDRWMGEFGDTAGLTQQQIDDLRAAMEDLPKAISEQDIADAIAAGAARATMALIDMIRLVRGEEFGVAEYRRAQTVLFKLQLAAQIAAIQALLAATDLLDKKSRRILEGLLDTGLDILGDPNLQLDQGAGAGAGGGRRQARESAAQAFADQLEQIQRQLSGMTQAEIGYLDARERLVQSAKDGQISTEALVDALASLAQVQAEAAAAPFREALQQGREGGIATSARQAAEAAQEALAAALVAQGANPEAWRAAALAISQGLASQLQAIGREGLASIGGTSAPLRDSIRETTLDIQYMIEHMDELGLSMYQIGQAVREGILPGLADMAIKEAERVGDFDRAAELTERKERMEKNLLRIQVEGYRTQLAAAGVLNEYWNGVIDDFLADLDRPDLAGATTDWHAAAESFMSDLESLASSAGVDLPVEVAQAWAAAQFAIAQAEILAALASEDLRAQLLGMGVDIDGLAGWISGLSLGMQDLGDSIQYVQHTVPGLERTHQDTTTQAAGETLADILEEMRRAALSPMERLRQDWLDMLARIAAATGTAAERAQTLKQAEEEYARKRQEFLDDQLSGIDDLIARLRGGAESGRPAQDRLTEQLARFREISQRAIATGDLDLQQQVRDQAEALLPLIAKVWGGSGAAFGLQGEIAALLEQVRASVTTSAGLAPPPAAATLSFSGAAPAAFLSSPGTSAASAAASVVADGRAVIAELRALGGTLTGAMAAISRHEIYVGSDRHEELVNAVLAIRPQSSIPAPAAGSRI